MEFSLSVRLHNPALANIPSKLRSSSTFGKCMHIIEFLTDYCDKKGENIAKNQSLLILIYRKYVSL